MSWYSSDILDRMIAHLFEAAYLRPTHIRTFSIEVDFNRRALCGLLLGFKLNPSLDTPSASSQELATVTHKFTWQFQVFDKTARLNTSG